MIPIRIVIPGPPVAKGRPRFSRGRAYTPAKTRRGEIDIGWLAKQAMIGRKIIAGPVTALIEVSVPVPKSWSVAKRRKIAISGVLWPTGKPDLDNVAKLVLDAINKIVFNDDAQVIELRVLKFYAASPSTNVTVNVIE